VLRIRAEDIIGYQRKRRASGISGRTLNTEIGVLRRIVKWAKVWSIVADDVKMDRENTGEKKILFETAATGDSGEAER